MSFVTLPRRHHWKMLKKIMIVFFICEHIFWHIKMRSKYSLIFWTNWLHSYSQRFVRGPVAAPSASLWCSLFQTLPSPLRFGTDHDDSQYSHSMKAKFTASLKKGRVGTNQNWILMWKGNEPSPNFSSKAAGHMFTKFLLKNQTGQYFQSRKKWKWQKSREESAIFRKILDFCNLSNLIVKEKDVKGEWAVNNWVSGKEKM